MPTARSIPGRMSAWLRSLLAALVLSAAGTALLAPRVSAQGPFAPSEPEEPYAPINRRVESSDLAPVQLPLDLWRGLDAAAVEKWLASQSAPPRSPALHQLWRRMLLAPASPPGQQTGDDMVLLRLEALYRSGLLTDIAEVLGKGGVPDRNVQLWRARVDIGLGKREKGCQALATLSDLQTPKPLRAEKQLLTGYCAAVAGDTRAAALAASLAREEGSTAETLLAVLESLDGGVSSRPPLPARLSLLDYRFLELMGPIDGTEALQRAEPALLVALAGSEALDIKVQIAAAEAALRLNALSPEAVADVYRRLPNAASRAGAGARSGSVLQRAQLFRAIEAARAPQNEVRLVRALLDEARRSGVILQTARMLTPLFAKIWPSQEMASMAEAIVESALAGGELELARRWAESAANLQHWLALIDLADPQSGRVQPSGLLYLDDLAKRARMPPAALHRAVTVLDALDVDVPLRLWEAAGRVAQPAGGHLPETGVLADLAQASQQKETGRTILLAMRALGPDGPDGTNILALADALKSLKRAGLDADARRLAVEALFTGWPRTSGN